jgi:hypothetical protein
VSCHPCFPSPPYRKTLQFAIQSLPPAQELNKIQQAIQQDMGQSDTTGLSVPLNKTARLELEREESAKSADEDENLMKADNRISLRCGAICPSGCQQSCQLQRRQGSPWRCRQSTGTRQPPNARCYRNAFASRRQALACIEHQHKGNSGSTQY